MRRSRVPVAEKRSTEAKTKYNSSLCKTTSMGPKKTKDNFSVSMVSTRSSTEKKAREGAKDKQVEPTIEIDLETPDQSVDEVERRQQNPHRCPHGRSKSKNRGVFADRCIGRHNRQHPRDGERRLRGEEDILYG